MTGSGIRGTQQKTKREKEYSLKRKSLDLFGFVKYAQNIKMISIKKLKLWKLA